MTYFDYAMLAILALSIGISLWRGLIREVVSLLSWFVALWVALRLTGVVVEWLPPAINNPTARAITAFLGLFLGTIIALELLAWLVSKLLRSIGLGFVDRLLGAAFGFVRGLVIAFVLTLLGGLTALPERDWWRDALLAPPLATAVLAVRPLLPLDLARRIKYS
jgi:membrane protein required for colicin V production